MKNLDAKGSHGQSPYSGIYSSYGYYGACIPKPWAMIVSTNGDLYHIPVLVTSYVDMCQKF